MSRLLLGVLLQAAVCLAAVAQEPSPAFAPGDSWTYHYSVEGKDRGDYTETVRRTDGDTVELLTAVAGARSTIVTYDGRAHRYLVRYAVNGAGERGRAIPDSDRSGNRAPIRFPFSVGDRWRVLSRYRVNGDPITQEFGARVVGRETIKIPAGEFDAFKIELDGYWWNEQDIGVARGRQVEIYWYAPATKRFVRREITSYGISIAKTWNTVNYSRVDELVAFHLAPN